ncbi:MAG: repressor LexA [Clostridia bacterium]|nr:repressor LexA [Clostridia bacterium]
MNQNSDFGSRLRSLMEERGLSYDVLGEKLSMNPQTLNRYVLGKREPKAGVAAVIALALGVDLLWLQGYDVPKSSIVMPEGAIRAKREYALPILGVIRAGVPVLANEEIEGYASADVTDPEHHFYLRVSGDSMVNAGIREGDLVLIRQQDTAENGRIVACMVNGEDATLKRFRRQGDMVILQPENSAYEPRVIPAREFESGSARIVGVAVKLVRSL